MNNAILRHLGVALLGHWGVGKDTIPSYLLPTYTTYASDPSHFISLLRLVLLRDYIMHSELPISDDEISRASLCALAVIIGRVSLESSQQHYELTSNDKLFNQMKSILRIRRVAGDS